MEKYTGNKSDHQQWFDYEYKGFHLVLNLEEVQNTNTLSWLKCLKNDSAH